MESSKTIGLSLLLSLFVFGWLISCAVREEIVLAEVDSELITEKELKRAYQMHRGILEDVREAIPEGDEQKYKDTLLESLIKHHILLIQARRQGLKIDAGALQEHLAKMKHGYDHDNFEEQLARLGLTVREWETIQQEKFLVQSWIRHRILSAIHISQDEVKEYYRNNSDEFIRPEQVRALHIFVNSAEKAEEILKKIEDGEDFEALARNHSRAPEAARGGDLGYFTREAYPPVFTETCFKLQKGKHSGIVASDYGFHLFLVVDKRPQKKLSFKEVSPDIHRILTQKKVQESIEKTIEQLRHSMNIKINQELLNKVRL